MPSPALLLSFPSKTFRMPGGVLCQGLFYPSKVGHRWPNGTVEDTQHPYGMAAYYRLASNLDSLAERGLDPLQLLIDASHEHSMEFVASLRVPAYLGPDVDTVQLDPARGVMTDVRVRDVQLAILTELATDYNTDGVELDLSCGPGGSAPVLRPEEAAEYAPILTEWVRSVAKVVHGRSGGRGLVGVRVYPTLAMNAALGLEVQRWIRGATALCLLESPHVHAASLV
jgi:hypothetical protein